MKEQFRVRIRTKTRQPLSKNGFKALKDEIAYCVEQAYLLYGKPDHQGRVRLPEVRVRLRQK